MSEKAALGFFLFILFASPWRGAAAEEIVFFPSEGKSENDWFRSDHNREADRELFYQRTQHKFSDMQDRLGKLRKRDSLTREEQDRLHRLQKRWEQGLKTFKRLKSANRESQKEVRAEFETSMAGLTQDFQTLGREMLSQKEAALWTAQWLAEDMSYQLEQLRRASERAEEEIRPVLGVQLRQLEQRQKDTLDLSKEIESAKKLDWEALHKRMEKNRKSFNVRYRSAVSSLP